MPNYKTVISRLEQLKNDLPVIVGSEMVAHALDNLRADGFDGTSWDPPAPHGLILNGDGFRSINFNTDGKIVELTAEEYMVAHNEGARIRGTQNVRAHSRQGRPVRAHSRTVDFTLPERKFAGKSKALDKRIGKVFYSRFKRAFL